MKTRASSMSAAVDERRSAVNAPVIAQMKQAGAAAMPDTRAASLAQLQHQERASNSGQATQLKARAEMMAGGGEAPVQRVEDEELLQGKFSVAQRMDEDDLLQGKFAPVQRVEDEDLLQGKFSVAQRMDEEELLQGKFAPVQREQDEELLQGKFATVQRDEDEELLQGKFAPVQRMDEEGPQQGKFDALQRANDMTPVQREEKPNHTGLPNQLKSGIESLSGMSMDHVKVHYNSDKPAQLQAHAYAQGSEIHVAPGQERHLPHEAWHVVQQAQGRVRPTMQMKAGVAVNDDAGLEREADSMGARAMGAGPVRAEPEAPHAASPSVQLKIKVDVENRQQENRAAVIQAYGLVNVALDVGEDNTTVFVSNISFHERVPTDADGGKGDHIIAETLITSSLLNVKGCTVYQLLAYLEKLAIANLGGTETARHTDREYEERHQLDCASFFEELSRGIEGVHPVKVAGRLGELCTMYWRLLEKRPATAFPRGDGKTTGGSGGTDEAAGMKLLHAIDDRFQNLDTSAWHDIFSHQEPIAKILKEKMMDLVVGQFSSEQLYYLCHRAATAVALKLQIDNTGWINQVAAYTYKFFTGQGIGPRKPGADPFV